MQKAYIQITPLYKQRQLRCIVHASVFIFGIKTVSMLEYLLIAVMATQQHYHSAAVSIDDVPETIFHNHFLVGIFDDPNQIVDTVFVQVALDFVINEISVR